MRAKAWRHAAGKDRVTLLAQAPSRPRCLAKHIHMPPPSALEAEARQGARATSREVARP